MTGPNGRCRARSRRSGPDAGQATMELALALPLLVMLLLLVVQVGIVIHDRLLVGNAAREGARVAAVDPDPAAPRRAAEAASQLDPARTTVDVSGRGGPGDLVTVTVGYRSAVRVPVIAALLPEVPLTASTTMRVER